MDWRSLNIEMEEGGERFVVARPSFVVGLIGGVELPAAAQRVLDFWLAMRTTLAPLFILGSSSRSFRPLSGPMLTKLRSQLAVPGALRYAMLKDAPDFDIGHCSLQFLFGAHQDAGLQTAIAMAFPPAMGEMPACEATAHALHTLFAEIKPQQAFAGFGFSMVFGREYEAVALPKLLAYGKRFTGLDLPERYTEVRVGKRLKSAYWITGVKASVLQEHGIVVPPGLENNCDIFVRKTEGFMSFQAGACPPVGDRNRQPSDLDSLKRLHALLRPALLDRWAAANAFGFGVEDIDSWFSRFDTST